MTDYSKQCWNCGSTKVFPIGTWFQCDDCGATHVPQPEHLIRYDLTEAHIATAMS